MPGSAEDDEAVKQVFSSYFDKLVLCIQHNTLEISNSSLSRKLISVETHSEVLYDSTIPQMKATKLLSAIMHCMEHQSPSSCLESFLEILDDLIIYEEFTNGIRCTLEKRRSLAKSRKKEQGVWSRIVGKYPKSTTAQLVVSGIMVLAAAIVVMYHLQEPRSSRSRKESHPRAQEGTPNIGNTKMTTTPTGSEDELIIIPYMKGPEVVQLCIEKLKSPIFDMLDDNDFMRRVAYVMSDFGESMSGNGGIWQVSMTAFKDTMDTSAHYSLPRKYKKIWKAYGIDWTSVKYSDLNKPFYSALAARLYLSNFAELIPPPHRVDEQAEYWKFKYMRGAGNMNTFKEKVAELKISFVQ